MPIRLNGRRYAASICTSRFVAPVVTLDTKNIPAFFDIKLLNGTDAVNEIIATIKVSVKNCNMIFALLFPMESRIPTSFFRPLIHIVKSRAKIMILTIEMMRIIVFINFCMDSKGVETMSYSFVSMLSFKVFPFNSGKAESLS